MRRSLMVCVRRPRVFFQRERCFMAQILRLASSFLFTAAMVLLVIAAVSVTPTAAVAQSQPWCLNAAPPGCDGYCVIIFTNTCGESATGASCWCNSH